MKTRNILKQPILIAGPCAAESKKQVLIAIREAKKREISFLRVSLYKPRTKPGFDGLGEIGINLLIEAAKNGVNPATEVLTSEQAKKVSDLTLKAVPNTKLLLWIGSRNQNHQIQKEIAKVAAQDKRIYLMVKNQPWLSEEHWEGIVEHVLESGINPNQVILCHRGFIPTGHNPNGYRNMTDFDMAMKIKQKTNLPMIFDPSHTGGTVKNVFKVSAEAARRNFDGLLVEVHHDPKNALTDSKQQLTWSQFDDLVKNRTKSISKKMQAISIGNNLLSNTARVLDFDNYSKAFIVTDKNLEKILLKKIISKLPVKADYLVLPFGEKEKQIENVQKIWMAMQKSQCDRKSLVINVGGGVITDIGGFAASTFMRGIDFINIPTTLLSQVDASIGGKTGIDFNGIKNLIGTFNKPKEVIIDINTLKTLPKREFSSGFAEIIKHGLIKDKKYFELVTSKSPLEFDKDEMIEIISRSIDIKMEIVAQDQKEKDKRKLLNFGHTIGHALEALSLRSKNPLLHGEAISIGMVAEAKISQLLDLISESEFQKIQHVLANAGLPISYKKIKINGILEKIKSDKKNENGIVNFTLLNNIGSALINQNVNKTLILKALKGVVK